MKLLAQGLKQAWTQSLLTRKPYPNQTACSNQPSRNLQSVPKTASSTARNNRLPLSARVSTGALLWQRTLYLHLDLHKADLPLFRLLDRLLRMGVCSVPKVELDMQSFCRKKPWVTLVDCRIIPPCGQNPGSPGFSSLPQNGQYHGVGSGPGHQSPVELGATSYFSYPRSKVAEGGGAECAGAAVR